ncbi:MAG: hypothetical protein QM811_10045 [Pirellulales bacterium]
MQGEFVIQRRADGAMIVRVVSSRTDRQPSLPDAVFCFPIGDPQHDHWAKKFKAAQGETLRVQEELRCG